MSNKERLIANNEKIAEIRETLKKKQVSPTDMLQARVDSNNSCAYLFYMYEGDNVDFAKNLDTSRVTNMDYMFGTCKYLTNIPFEINSKNVTSMTYMFSNCERLTGIPKLNTENVKYMSSMFNKCFALSSIPLIDTSSAKSMSRMFERCDSLTTIPQLNTSNVTDMSNMFNTCAYLTTIPDLDTSNVTNISNLFYSCIRLTSIPKLDTSNATQMQNMFYNCRALMTIPEINAINATSMNSIFYNCTNLTNLTIKNIKINLMLGTGNDSMGSLLTNESLINTIKECWDLTGSTTRTLTMSTLQKNNIANIYVKLVDVTDEMLATDPYANNKKPCVVCESTDEGAMLITEYLTSKNWQLA